MPNSLITEAVTISTPAVFCHPLTGTVPAAGFSGREFVCKVVSISDYIISGYIIVKDWLVDGDILEVDAGISERVRIEVIAPDAQNDSEVFRRNVKVLDCHCAPAACAFGEC